MKRGESVKRQEFMNHTAVYTHIPSFRPVVILCFIFYISKRRGMIRTNVLFNLMLLSLLMDLNLMKEVNANALRIMYQITKSTIIKD